MATATDGAQKAGAHAGNLIKAIAGLVGGGGGGRPNMAQAGGKNPAGVDEALAKVAETVESTGKSNPASASIFYKFCHNSEKNLLTNV